MVIEYYASRLVMQGDTLTAREVYKAAMRIIKGEEDEYLPKGCLDDDGLEDLCFVMGARGHDNLREALTQAAQERLH